MAFTPNNVNGQATMANSAPVVVASNQSAIPVSFTGSGDVATQTTLAAINTKLVSGTDIGDVTINNASGASAVNIQDGGNSITVDGTVAVSGTVTVGSHAVTNAGTFVTQENGALLTSNQLLDDVVTAQGTAIGTTKTSLVGVSTTTAAPTYTTGTINPLNSNTSGALRVDGSGVTQPVSIASVPSHAVTNAGTFAVQNTAAIPAGTNNIGDVDVLTINGVAPAFGTGVRGATVQRVTIATDDSVPVTGTFYQATQPVSGTITANAGTGTMAVSNTVLSVVGGGTEATAQRVTIASDSTGVLSIDDNGGSITVDGTFWQATQPVSGTVTANAGTGTMAVSMATNTPLGTVAHDSADSGAPIKVGGRASSAEITAVTTGDRTDFITDLVGKQVVLPYANNENFVSGAITTAMTATTSTSLVAAPAAGLRNYITTIIVSNSHATVGTDVIIQDGSGGTTLMTIPAAALYGGAVINLPVPLRQPTTATAIYCANVTTGASTKVSAVGYKGY